MPVPCYDVLYHLNIHHSSLCFLPLTIISPVLVQVQNVKVISSDPSVSSTVAELPHRQGVCPNHQNNNILSEFLSAVRQDLLMPSSDPFVSFISKLTDWILKGLLWTADAMGWVKHHSLLPAQDARHRAEEGTSPKSHFPLDWSQRFHEGHPCCHTVSLMRVVAPAPGIATPLLSQLTQTLKHLIKKFSLRAEDKGFLLH